MTSRRPSGALSDVSSSREVVLRFEPLATSFDAIQRAAYKLSDRLSIDIEAGEQIAVTLHLPGAHCSDELVAEFRNEVLDQTLRERIRVESEAARNLILALAFSRTGLLEEE